MIAPAVILDRPQMGENGSACARAMMNCGLTDLRLVRTARWLAQSSGNGDGSQC